VDDLRVVKSFQDLNHGEVPPWALDCLFVTLQNAPEYSGRQSGELEDRAGKNRVLLVRGFSYEHDSGGRGHPRGHKATLGT
jgi:hypothetical protein